MASPKGYNRYNMPYTKNPNLPQVRMQAVKLTRSGWSTRKVARHLGFNQSTIVKWIKKAPQDGRLVIPTKSSRPHSHPKTLDWQTRQKIFDLRIKTHGRCAEVIQKMLSDQDIKVSLSTVKRTLKRNGLLKEKSPWKKYHQSGERPSALNPGDLVEIDTIHLWKNQKERLYVYTLLDVNSRWAYAYATKKLSARNTIEFVKRAKRQSLFDFKCLQSDHGPEFSPHFTRSIKERHRHSRVRKPNDNAHVERFNRTIQTELLRDIPLDVDIINGHLKQYLKYYNQERLHLGINLQTPWQILTKVMPSY